MKRCPDCQAFIARRRLNPRLLERSPCEELAVGYTVQRTTSRHCEIVEWNFLVQIVQEMKKSFFKTMLHGIS